MPYSEPISGHGACGAICQSYLMDFDPSVLSVVQIIPQVDSLLSSPVMSESAFGVVLRELREARQLSLRDLSALAEVDHAYIAKIERGDKEPPPEETFIRLARHLKATAHQVAVLRFLRTSNSVDRALALHALANTDATPEILAIAATVVHRGSARPSPADLIERAVRAKRIMDGQ